MASWQIKSYAHVTIRVNVVCILSLLSKKIKKLITNIVKL